MTQRAYKFRFYPNRTQEQQLRQFFGCARFVWNAALAWRSDVYKTFSEHVSGTDFSRELTWLKKVEKYDWLNDCPATVMVQALRDQDHAFKRFFKEGAGYPRFKKRHHEQSIRMQLDQRIVLNNYRAGDLLKVPGLGKLKLVWSRLPSGIPKMVTISRDTANRYFVSMAVEETVVPLPVVAKTIGLDVGLQKLITCSDGQVIDNVRHLQRHDDPLKTLQQRLSRQKKGSGRYHRTKQRLARLHARIKDCRREYSHQITTRIIYENQVICVEDLNVKGMTASAMGTTEAPGKMVKQKSGLNRALLNASFGELSRQLQYKANWYGRTLLQVDRFYASSKTCSCCGHKLDELRLDVRQWTCPKCHATHDRDLNAAKNIEREGLKQLIHPEDTGGVRVAGSEGACPRTVSTRSSVHSIADLESVN